MKAIIMAGGEGSRLRPLTCDLPKPIVPVFNKPIMEHTIELLKSYNITEVGVTLQYLPQKIKDYFGNGSNWGVNIHYFTEDSPLGTAGSVKNADEFLDETFIVISGDALTDMNLKEAIEFHSKNKALATLILSKVEVPLEYGVVVTDKTGRITGFLEKPSWSEVFSDTVNTGTYILEPKALKYFEKGKKFDFSQDLFPMLLKDNQPMYGFVTNNYWCDIGDLKSYLQSHYDIFDSKVKINIPGQEIKPKVWVGNGTIIEPGATINAPTYIGNNCYIGSDAVIDSYSIIGDNNTINEEVSLKRSILWNGNFIEQGAQISGGILCNKTNIKKNVTIYENAVIGDNCLINERAIIKPNVKVWPDKSIDTLAIVDRNVIWGSRHLKTIFGENGLCGVINVDISPEFATRLGAAYGSQFKRGQKILVSCTPSNATRMFKHAFISGILSVGIDVINLSSVLTPMARYAVNFLTCDGGIHIKLLEDDQKKICAEFLDTKGGTISRGMERKIENAFIREDFKRCQYNEISQLSSISDFYTYYTKLIATDINKTAIKKRPMKIFLVSPSEFVISQLVPIIQELGCKVMTLNASYNDETVYTMKNEIAINKLDFAAYIDSNAEHLELIDSKGVMIKDDLFTALCSLIVFETHKSKTAIVPTTAPFVIEELAKKYEGNVTRTKTSARAIMGEMLNLNLYTNNKENLSQFLLSFDAFAGIFKILEFLAFKQTSLAQVIESIPKFYISKKKVFCPWEAKGKVMRMLIEDKSERKMELLDGVKFIDNDGWVLVVPDADKPNCRIYSEGNTQEIADKLANEFELKIKELL